MNYLTNLLDELRLGINRFDDNYGSMLGATNPITEQNPLLNLITDESIKQGLIDKANQTIENDNRLNRLRFALNVYGLGQESPVRRSIADVSPFLGQLQQANKATTAGLNQDLTNSLLLPAQIAQLQAKSLPKTMANPITINSGLDEKKTYTLNELKEAFTSPIKQYSPAVTDIDAKERIKQKNQILEGFDNVGLLLSQTPDIKLTPVQYQNAYNFVRSKGSDVTTLPSIAPEYYTTIGYNSIGNLYGNDNIQAELKDIILPRNSLSDSARILGINQAIKDIKNRKNSDFAFENLKKLGFDLEKGVLPTKNQIIKNLTENMPTTITQDKPQLSTTEAPPDLNPIVEGTAPPDTSLLNQADQRAEALEMANQIINQQEQANQPPTDTGVPDYVKDQTDVNLDEVTQQNEQLKKYKPSIVTGADGIETLEFGQIFGPGDIGILNTSNVRENVKRYLRKKITADADRLGLTGDEIDDAVKRDLELYDKMTAKLPMLVDKSGLMEEKIKNVLSNEEGLKLLTIESDTYLDAMVEGIIGNVPLTGGAQALKAARDDLTAILNQIWVKTLQDMARASPNGSTLMGQLSNAEGSRLDKLLGGLGLEQITAEDGSISYSVPRGSLKQSYAQVVKNLNLILDTLKDQRLQTRSFYNGAFGLNFRY